MGRQMVGAAPEELDALSTAMANSARQLDGIATGLRSEVAKSPWRGSDATAFRSDWTERHERVVRAAAEALNVAARTLTSQAREQEHASDGAGGSTGGAFAANALLAGLTAQQWRELSGGIGDDVNLSALFLSTATAFTWAQAVDTKHLKPFGAEAAGITFPFLEAVGSGLTVAGGVATVIGDPTSIPGWGGVVGGAASLAGHSTLGGAIGAGADTLDIVVNGGSAWDVAHVGVEWVGVAFPPVGMGLAAFDAGMAIGNGIAQIPAVQAGISDIGDSVVSAGAKTVDGDVYTDPAAAERLVRRYEGPQGFGHFLVDGATSSFTTFANLF